MSRLRVASTAVGVALVLTAVLVGIWWWQRGDVRAMTALVESIAETAGIDADELDFGGPIERDLACPDGQGGTRTEVTGFVRVDLRARAESSAVALADDGWRVHRLVGTGNRSTWLLIQAVRSSELVDLDFRSDSLWITGATESCGDPTIELRPFYRTVTAFSSVP